MTQTQGQSLRNHPLTVNREKCLDRHRPGGGQPTSRFSLSDTFASAAFRYACCGCREPMALLQDSIFGRGSPFAGSFHETQCPSGIPSFVIVFRIEHAMWTSVTCAGIDRLLRVPPNSFLKRHTAVSTRLRRVYPDAFCQWRRPWLAICSTFLSRWSLSTPALSLVFALRPGGMRIRVGVAPSDAWSSMAR